MTPDQLKQLLQATLDAGCGVLISALYQMWIDSLKNPPAQWESRLAVFGLCVVVPTILFAAGSLFGWWGFAVDQDVAYVVGAFTSSTLWHGLTQLRSKSPAPPPTATQ